MNLLELLKQELKTKNIIDKELIARYIYIRIGELFDYDESYLFENWDEQQNIVNQWDKQIGYRKNTEIMLSMLKKELQEKYPNKEDYIYNSYKAVQYIMQFPKERMEHTSGRKYIHFLLKYFLELVNFIQLKIISLYKPMVFNYQINLYTIYIEEKINRVILFKKYLKKQ